ncbi:MAG: hypothetical protein KME49_20155 [Brasilonema octagenarum HA4186-MV1]|jgi:hypothetical protein|uniref:Uncharacterized protein n=2 Tax=Brasilonema TaxID=383614 RepID=A0A856MKW6_9CYAN|nr:MULTISPECIES: hypothetical protein [Brasilonema]MBW4627750.1 hypothetical protein [Brasilonema octagenarum HA4186-MV1]NMF63184.1 hypothetical protein [Brasilonema octagenarum UFV-OR1]QDL12025.1 hypothetical protein DP114_32695 [Brasilonema sennae CENA114]QDL18400.1 hypothetical protein DP113_32795 [Brasilonema octagenarum UFV-E1]
MESIKIADLDNEPISFDLSQEDLNSIKGGTTTLNSTNDQAKTVFPIRIVRYPIRITPFPIRVFIIQIKAAPIDPIALNEAGS